MKKLQKEEMGENRMLLPELSSGAPAFYPPIQLERLAHQERRPIPPPRDCAQAESTKDVGSILAPEAMAALRAALSGNKPESHTLNPTQERRFETRVPVIKTSNGSFMVTHSPHVSLINTHRSPFPQRIPSQPPMGLPGEYSFFTTPERRINIQNAARSATAHRSPATTCPYLLQAGIGKYRVIGGSDGHRVVDEHLTPFDRKHTTSIVSQPVLSTERTVVQQVNIPQRPSQPFKQTKILPLAPKLHVYSEIPHNRMPLLPPPTQQKIPEKPPPLQCSANTGLEAKVENLKSRFIGEGNHLPLSSVEDLFPTSKGKSEAHSTPRVPRKRRKTLTPATLTDAELRASSANQAGVDVLLKAALSIGDSLPPESALQGRGVRRQARERKASSSSDLDREKESGVLDSFAGVYPVLRNRLYVARCRYKGCYVEIGSFTSAEDAARAYDRVVLSIKGDKAETNYRHDDYLSFELQNARRAFEEKYKQYERPRRGSTWPWVRSAQMLFSKEEVGSDDCVQELNKTLPIHLTEAIPGKCVFELLQSVMLKNKDLTGTYDLIQAKIRQLQTRIQSGLSTEEECDCVGQYACAARILGNMVSMQKEWEKKHRSKKVTSAAALLDESSSSSLPDRSISDPKNPNSG